MVKNLKKLRANKGISQQQLADVIGTSQQSVNKYENHNVEPDIDTLIRIADYFNTTVDYLIGHMAQSEAKELVEEWDLNREEAVLIREYRRISKEEKESIRMVLKNYLKNKEEGSRKPER